MEFWKNKHPFLPRHQRPALYLVLCPLVSFGRQVKTAGRPFSIARLFFMCLYLVCFNSEDIPFYHSSNSNTLHPMYVCFVWCPRVLIACPDPRVFGVVGGHSHGGNANFRQDPHGQNDHIGRRVLRLDCQCQDKNSGTNTVTHCHMHLFESVRTDGITLPFDMDSPYLLIAHLRSPHTCGLAFQLARHLFT
jgi:hypothetical protein